LNNNGYKDGVCVARRDILYIVKYGKYITVRVEKDAVTSHGQRRDGTQR